MVSVLLRGIRSKLINGNNQKTKQHSRQKWSMVMKTIAIIDDDVQIGDVLTKILEKEG